MKIISKIMVWALDNSIFTIPLYQNIDYFVSAKIKKVIYSSGY